MIRFDQITAMARQKHGAILSRVLSMARRQTSFRYLPTQNVKPLRAVLGMMLIAPMCITFTAANLVRAQNQSTRISGPKDTDVALPTATGVVRRTDLAALQEIQEFVKATGTTNCGSFQGEGTIQYDSPDGPKLSAALTSQQGREYRLDVTTSKGLRSVRIYGASGVVHDDDGTVESLVPETAALGFIQAETLPCMLLTGQTVSFIDHGIVPANHLHRITLEFALGRLYGGAALHKTSVIDFYFDPISHLLQKSVSLIRIAEARNQDFIRTVTYSDYRVIGISSIPFQYRESLNGQQTWLLQLSQVQVTDGKLPVSYFKF